MNIVELYKINLASIIAFPVLKLLDNLLSMQKSLFDGVSKITTSDMTFDTTSVQYDMTFIFTDLSETLNSFVKIRLVFEVKNVLSFIKTCFY